MKEITTDLLVVGGGPAGYTAAFRAADLGSKVILVEEHSKLGGVCLNVGCIPSKTLLHIAKVKEEVEHLNSLSIVNEKLSLNPKAAIKHKDSVINSLSLGLKALAKKRDVTVINGYGKFSSENSLVVEDTIINFKKSIIAVGSKPIRLPFLPDDKRILDSTTALELENPKANLLVLGGGIIGLEMTNIYEAFGAKITIAELGSQLIAEADSDVIEVYTKRLTPKLKNLYLNTKVTKVVADKKLIVHFENSEKSWTEEFDNVMVAVGRMPNGDLINAEKAGVNVTDKGFIEVNKKMETNQKHIYAIGDVIGQPMLAHKALHEAKIAAENQAGQDHYFEPKVIPSVAYTNPEIAWTGILEKEAKAKNIDYGVGMFPLAASGRATSQGVNYGLAKLIFNKENNIIIGGTIFAPGAGDLISEVCLAIEMNCDAEDIALTIHPHPTLSESIHGACEVYNKTVTDLLNT